MLPRAPPSRRIEPDGKQAALQRLLIAGVLIGDARFQLRKISIGAHSLIACLARRVAQRARKRESIVIAEAQTVGQVKTKRQLCNHTRHLAWGCVGDHHVAHVQPRQPVRVRRLPIALRVSCNRQHVT